MVILMIVLVVALGIVIFDVVNMDKRIDDLIKAHNDYVDIVNDRIEALEKKSDLSKFRQRN